MAAPTVHLLSSATFASTAIADAVSASIDEGGSVQEYISADVATVQLTTVEKIGATVTVTSLKYAASPAIGDTGALSVVLKPRVEGKGVSASTVTISFAVAVCTGKSAGPVIEGSPSYAYTFRCHATAT
jgi:hypothetical protein